MSEHISYKGEVRITSRYKGSLIREQIVHNEGKPYLFSYLCQCLAAIQGITGNNPNQIKVIGGGTDQSQSRSATARYNYEVDKTDATKYTYYAEFSATFTQNDFQADGYSNTTSEGGKGYVKLELKRDTNLFAETSVENFTKMSKGEAVTIVWRMTFTDASSSTDETQKQSVASPISVQTVSAPKKKVKTTRKEAEVVKNG